MTTLICVCAVLMVFAIILELRPEDKGCAISPHDHHILRMVSGILFAACSFVIAIGEFLNIISYANMGHMIFVIAFMLLGFVLLYNAVFHFVKWIKLRWC